MKIRYPLIALSMLLGSITATHAQVSIGIGLPGVNIGINMPTYPNLVLIPGYPVYYDPRANANYFFYDGLYWVYQADEWYESSWYNGPWAAVQPEYVPLFLLRIPVRYYRQPPVYFRGWRSDAPPRWGDHWGRDWEQSHRDWDRWDRRSAPNAAPLPLYQRQYSGNRYPRAAEQQRAIRTEQYRYQPRDAVTRQRFGQRDNPERSPAPQQQQQQHQQHQQQQQRQHQQQQQQQQQRQPQHSQPVPQQIQRPQHETQDNARNRGAEQQRRMQDSRAQQPGNAIEHNAAPQGRRPENNAESHNRSRENRPEPQDQGRGNRNEERDQNRR